MLRNQRNSEGLKSNQGSWATTKDSLWLRSHEGRISWANDKWRSRQIKKQDETSNIRRKIDWK